MPDVEDVTCSDGFDSRKGAWTADEDAKLKQLVEQHGTSNWSIISQGVPGRSGKSCRLRWCNQLDPSVSKLPFSEWEQAVIIRAQSVHQNRWAAIARLLNGRTDNAVKNHWHATLNRKHQNGALKNKYLEEGATLEWLLANPEHGKEPEEKAYMAIMSKAPPARGAGSKASKKRPSRGRPRWSDSSTDSEEAAAAAAAERSCTAHTSGKGAAAATGAEDFVATSGSCEGDDAALLDSAAAAAAMPGYIPSSGGAAAVAADMYNTAGQAPASAATACSPNRPAAQVMSTLNNASSYRQLRVDVSGSSWAEPEQHSDMAAATTLAGAGPIECWRTPASDLTPVADAYAERPASNALQHKTQQLPASTYNSSEVSSCGGSPSLVPSAALVPAPQPGPGAGWPSTAAGPTSPGSLAARPGAVAADIALQLAACDGQGLGYTHARTSGSSFSEGTGTGVDGSMYGGRSSYDEAATAGYQQQFELRQQQYYQQHAAAASRAQYAATAGPSGMRYSSTWEWHDSSSYEASGAAAGIYPSTVLHSSSVAPSARARDSPGIGAPAPFMAAAELPSVPLRYSSDRGATGASGYQMDRTAAGLEPGTNWPGPAQRNAEAVTAVLRSASTASGSVCHPHAPRLSAGEQQQRHEILPTVGSTKSLDAHTLQHQFSAAAMPPDSGGLLTSYASAASVNQAPAGDAATAAAVIGAAAPTAAALETADGQQQKRDNTPAEAEAAAAGGDYDEVMADPEPAPAAASADAAGPSMAPEQGDGTATVTISRCTTGPKSSDQQGKAGWSTPDQQAGDQQASSELAVLPPSTAPPGTASVQASDSPRVAQRTGLVQAGPAGPGSDPTAASHPSERPRSNSMPAPTVQLQPQQQLQRGYSSYSELSAWPSGQLPAPPPGAAMMQEGAPGMLAGPPSGQMRAANMLPGLQPGRRQMMPPGVPESSFPGSGYPPEFTRYGPPDMPGMQGPPAAGLYMGAPLPAPPAAGLYRGAPLPAPPPGPCGCWECRQAAAAGLPLPGMPPPYSRPYDGRSMGPELVPGGGFSGPVRSRPYAPNFRPRPYDVPGSFVRSSSRYQQQYCRGEVFDGKGCYETAGAPSSAPGAGFYGPSSGPSSVGGSAAGAGGFGPSGRVASAPNLMAPQRGGLGPAGWQGSSLTPCSQLGYPGPEPGMPPPTDYYSSYGYGPAAPRGLQQMHSAPGDRAACMPPPAADIRGPAPAPRSLSYSALGGGNGNYAELQLQQPQSSSWSGKGNASGMDPGMSGLHQQRQSSAGGHYFDGYANGQHLSYGGTSSNSAKYGGQWQLAAVLPGMPLMSNAAELDGWPASRSSQVILEGIVTKRSVPSAAAAASNSGNLIDAAACSSAPARVPTPGLSSAATAAALMGRGFSDELGGASCLELVSLDLEKDGLMGALDDMLGPCDLEDELLMIA